MDILIIKNKIKEFLKLIYVFPHYKTVFKELKGDKRSKIILFGTPAHGNLGDQAIAISEMDYLLTIAGRRKVVEIPMPLFKTYRKKIKRYIGDNDTIIISGGGWMGNLWIHNEITIREIVSDYINNRVIIFPQTLFYTKDECGRKTIVDTKKIFDLHPDLILTVRDKTSLECARTQLGFRENINLLFCPDMVIYGTLAKESVQLTDKKKALICLRNDIEKKHNLSSVKSILEEVGYTIKETSTVIDGFIPMNRRKQVVVDKIDEFSDASIVITDRLHAMLFSLLAGTPCFVFDNVTGKVFGVGEYLAKNKMPVYLINELSSSVICEADIKKRRYHLTNSLSDYYKKLEQFVNSEEIM